MQAGAEELIRAAKRGDLSELCELLGSGIDPNTQDDDGTPVLWHACSRVVPIRLAMSCCPCVAMLLSAGAAPDGRNRWGVTPLMRTAWFGQAAICTQLLSAGADPAAKASDGCWRGMTAKEIALRSLPHEMRHTQPDRLRESNVHRPW